jgi:long-chain acyl-CoA synthetase
MNIYEKLQSSVDMPEGHIYQELYDALINQDKINFMGLILQRAARLFSHDTALICQDKQMSYRELYYRACSVSILLKERGVKPHDRVLVLMENSFAFYVAYFGITQIGAVVVPLNIFLHEKELAHIIQDAQPTFFICSSARTEKIRESASQLPPMIDEQDLKLEEPVPDEIPHFEVTRLPFDEMAALLYTSGTTGFPKGVMLSSRNILTNVVQVITRFGLIKQQRVLAVLPLFHSLAQNICVWSSILMGCTVIIVPKIDRRLLLNGLKHKPTIFVGVPALFAVLCLLKTAPLDSIHYFFSGGDALPDRIRSAFSLIYRRKICSGYGTTEASPVISVDMEDVAEPTNCTGKPLVGVHCAIKDDSWNTLPVNNIGQIWIKGDNIMLGYYNAPEVNEAVFKDGWFATGDLGYLDDNHKVVITGRVKDLIVSKGINIYPQEIENVILLSPNVTAVGVIGQDDPDSGQIPVAYVTVRQMGPQVELELRKLCAQHLAAYKVPKQFICSTQPLATTATGKVDKKVLRKLHAERLDKAQ